MGTSAAGAATEVATTTAASVAGTSTAGPTGDGVKVGMGVRVGAIGGASSRRGQPANSTPTIKRQLTLCQPEKRCKYFILLVPLVYRFLKIRTTLGFMQNLQRGKIHLASLQILL